MRRGVNRLGNVRSVPVGAFAVGATPAVKATMNGVVVWSTRSSRQVCNFGKSSYKRRTKSRTLDQLESSQHSTSVGGQIHLRLSTNS